MTRAYPDQRVAWLWEDGWTLVRATAVRERDRLLGRFARCAPYEAQTGKIFLRGIFAESYGYTAIPMFVFDQHGHRRAVVSVDVHLRFLLYPPHPLRSRFYSGRDVDAVQHHYQSVVQDLGGRDRKWPDPNSTRAYYPGSCLDPSCEADLLLGQIPHLFTLPTPEFSLERVA